jgi:hypothetical protein
MTVGKNGNASRGPDEAQVIAMLGAAHEVWDGIIAAIGRQFQPLNREWKPSKSEFGWICLLKYKKRTLLYMTPDQGQVGVAVVLGERAVAIALESGLPVEIKRLIREARPYAEGRGIRFRANSRDDIPMITTLVDIKTTPK